MKKCISKSLDLLSSHFFLLPLPITLLPINHETLFSIFLNGFHAHACSRAEPQDYGSRHCIL